MFNSADYTVRLETGQLKRVLIREHHLKTETSQAKRMPFCTVGQIYRYLDKENEWHAEVHQYLMPNGQLGASGLPDPKRLRRNGTVWAIERK